MDEEITRPRSTSSWTAYRCILGYIAVFIAIIGALMLFPLIFIAFYQDEWMGFASFLIPGASCLVVGGVAAFFLMRKAKKIRLGKHQDSVLLVAIWLLSIALGALPFFLAQYLDSSKACQTAMSMSYSEAFFETCSGFSTTGLTVWRNYSDSGVTYCPHIYGIYRILTQFIGGVGFVLVLTSVVSDRYGLKLFSAEGHNDRLLPNLWKTAKATFALYLAVIVVGAIALILCGYPVYDSFAHSIAAMATGGFSTLSNGIATYVEIADGTIMEGALLPLHALAGEIVLDVIMLLGSTSFLLLFYLFTFKWKKFFKDSEIHFAAILLVILIVIASISILNQCEEGLNYWQSLRYASFEMISALSTTGFSNVSDLYVLGNVAVTLCALSTLIGGGSGSTSGGIKQLRVVIIGKELWWSMKYRLTPTAMRVNKPLYRAGVASQPDGEEFKAAGIYAFLYLGVIALMSLILIFLPNMGITDAFYEISSAISSTGLSFMDLLAYKASNNLACYNLLLWVLSTTMFLGRLEIMPIYFGIVRVGRDIFRKETA